MSTTRSPRTPVRNAAAARRMRSSLTAQTQAAPVLSDPLLAVVAAFQPRPPLHEAWPTLRPVVAEVLAHSVVRGPDSVRKHLTHLGYFYVWAAAQGLPLVPATLVRAYVDEYTRVGMTGSSAKSRADRRARLRSVADQVNPLQAPDRGVPVPRPSIRPPYTAAELQLLIRVAMTQPTPERTRKAAVCIGLGAGAGLDSRDFRGLRREHIRDTGDALVVEVPGTPTRSVPVRKQLEGLVRVGIADREPAELLLGRVEERRNLAAQAIDDVVVLGDCPRIEQARLRATWLATLLRQPVPLDVVMTAAGLRSARTLADLLEHLEPLDPGQVAAFLQGAAVAA